MAENIQFFSTKSIGLSRIGARKPCTLEQAARHNLREIQAELGAHRRIDARLIKNNTLLAGPKTAVEVKALADELLSSAGLDRTRMRRDHCQAIELVFSVAPDMMSEPLTYLRRCLDWATVAMGLPVLSAVAHLDERAPHLHVLLLPLLKGKYVGGKPISKIPLGVLRERFFNTVAGPAGLQRANAKLTGHLKRNAVDAVIARCRANGYPESLGGLWPVLVAAIERDPTRSVLALDIPLEDLRNPIGIAHNPIGFQHAESQDEPYHCVGIAQPGDLLTAATAVVSLTELWERVGMKAFTADFPQKGATRKQVFRNESRHGPMRSTRTPPVLRVGGSYDHSKLPQVPAKGRCDEDVVRVRDEYAQDLSAWDD